MTPWPIFQPLILAYFVTGGNRQLEKQAFATLRRLRQSTVLAE